MKKNLCLAIGSTILIAGYFHFTGKKREENIVVKENPSKSVSTQEKNIPLIVSDQSPPPKNIPTLIPSWMKNRLAIVKAIGNEKNNLKKLDQISDSKTTWLVSQKYRGIHHRNFVPGTPFIAKIGRYYVVENEGENSNIVYNKKMGNMGVISGSLMVKVKPHSDVEALLNKWEQDENLEVGLTFLHIGVVELKTYPNEYIAQMAKGLARQEGVERVKIDIIGNDTHSW